MVSYYNKTRSKYNKVGSFYEKQDHILTMWDHEPHIYIKGTCYTTPLYKWWQNVATTITSAVEKLTGFPHCIFLVKAKSVHKRPDIISILEFIRLVKLNG
jgi:hypothetical protein